MDPSKWFHFYIHHGFYWSLRDGTKWHHHCWLGVNHHIPLNSPVNLDISLTPHLSSLNLIKSPFSFSSLPLNLQVHLFNPIKSAVFMVNPQRNHIFGCFKAFLWCPFNPQSDVPDLHLGSCNDLWLKMWGFPQREDPQNVWFIVMENHIKVDDLGVPTF